jgi:hypothetical protein
MTTWTGAYEKDIFSEFACQKMKKLKQNQALVSVSLPDLSFLYAKYFQKLAPFARALRTKTKTTCGGLRERNYFSILYKMGKRPSVAPAPDAAPVKRKRKNKGTKTEITFDPKARTEFLTGFRKRKNERRKAAAEKMEKKYKEEVKNAK